MELLKLLNSNEVIIQIISFLVMLTVLRFLLWGRVLKALDARKEKIAKDLSDIEAGKASVEEFKRLYADKLGAIEETARGRIQEAVVEGQRVVEQMKRDGQNETKQMVERAKEEIQYEVRKAQTEFRDQVADLVVTTMERVIPERLTAADDRKIVEELIKKVDATS
ncbi:MAG: F0F1 ATP synthase subunit B [Candidatus Omnitrophica bacterium]|nr:F0F1 ATP synthase subunit B [Candidatus Omnitrophota bacterium]